jgi:hypothetical protein
VGDIRLCEWEKTVEREGRRENKGKGVSVREHVSGELERKGERGGWWERDAERGIKERKTKRIQGEQSKTNEEKTREEVERKETEKEIQERAKAEVRVERVQACWLSRKNFGTIS